ncbi:metallophosphoesterase family protein [Desulforhopalus singaporensis]|uniref:Predicted phosphodiesterase n=1 Tax=Desulforhopalus singaporensis TaxID=91360 RepID=A0A1H0K2K3_9BACT|nr:metallophosphoesterase [Desulforhopalus singaporensis]SDO50268.1 Predicted phosphodiesterase [Desulforhopalus singaporensis]
MRVAVLSDIHGNYEALAAVVRDLDGQRAAAVVCLGDMVGYGPDPEKVIALVRDSGYRCILGNHEFALNDDRGRAWFNFLAAENNRATQKLLSAQSLRFCRTLPAFLEFAGAHFVHGFPKDNVFRYLHRQDDETLVKLFDRLPLRLVFVGHTHRLQLVGVRPPAVARKGLAEGITALGQDSKYIVNCGSVGQPRDNDNRAKYIVWDSDDATVEVRCVTYDFKRTMEKIRGLGFPDIYALRLA